MSKKTLDLEKLCDDVKNYDLSLYFSDAVQKITAAEYPNYDKALYRLAGVAHQALCSEYKNANIGDFNNECFRQLKLNKLQLRELEEVVTGIERWDSLEMASSFKVKAAKTIKDILQIRHAIECQNNTTVVLKLIPGIVSVVEDFLLHAHPYKLNRVPWVTLNVGVDNQPKYYTFFYHLRNILPLYFYELGFERPLYAELERHDRFYTNSKPKRKRRKSKTKKVKNTGIRDLWSRIRELIGNKIR